MVSSFRKLFSSLLVLAIMFSMLPVSHGMAAAKTTLSQVRPMVEANGDEVPPTNFFFVDDMDFSPNGDGKFDSTDVNFALNADQPFAAIELVDRKNPYAGPERDGYIGYLFAGENVPAGYWYTPFDGTYYSYADGIEKVKAADGIYDLELWSINAEQDDYIIRPTRIGPIFIKTTPPRIGGNNMTTSNKNDSFWGYIGDSYIDWRGPVIGMYHESYDVNSKLFFTYDVTNSKGEKAMAGASIKMDQNGYFSAPMQGLTIGDNKIKIYVDDIVGNHSEKEYTVTLKDTTGPVITPQITGSGGNLWFDDEVTISLDVTDDISGVRSIEYKINDGDWIPYTGPFKVATVERTAVQFRSFDNVGNSTYKTIFFKNDNYAPVTKATLDGTKGSDFSPWFRTDVVFSLTATDDASGIKSTQYKIEDGEWTEYTTPLTFTKEGVTTVSYRSTDHSGKTEETHVAYVKIDKTPPVISGVENGKVYNTDVTPTYNEGDGRLNNWYTNSGTTIKNEGNYTLVVTDEAGNVSSVSFKIDKTAPVVTGVENGKTYTSNVTITFNEGTATLDGIPMYNEKIVSDNGNYKLVVTDEAGNVTTINFTIEKTAPPVVNPPSDPGPGPGPIINPPPSGPGPGAGSGTPPSPAPTDKTPPTVSGVENGGAYNRNVTITFSDGTATLNGKEIAYNTIVNAEGTYLLVVKDVAGNATTINFTIDKKAPIVSGVKNKAIYNKNVTITFNEGTATLNGDWIDNKTTVKADGSYTLVVTDEAGNETTVKFTVDKKSPTVSGVANNGNYNKDVTIRFNEGTATLNGKKMGNTTVVKAAGSYVVVVTDAAGNKTTIKFTIDKTAPKIPTVNPITTKSKTVTGKAEKGSTVYLYSGKKLLGKAVANAKGDYSIKLAAQKKGTTLTIHAKDPAGNQSKAIVAKVK